MTPVYRIFRRTDRGSQVIVEIRGPEITGPFADLVRERLIHFGFPRVPTEEALQRFRSHNPHYISFDCIDEPDD